MGDGMTGRNDSAPIIVRRKKVIAKTAHHGGAWKVAYADFVTAMMAFFLMMWLLGATTESQRRGLADYFNPSIPIHRISSGGDGMFGGTDLETRAEAGPDMPSENAVSTGDQTAVETQSFDEIEQRLNGLGGESALLRDALRHVVTRQTDEGLVIEIFDLPDRPLFDADSASPNPVLLLLAPVLTEVFGTVVNGLAIEGHTRAYSIVHATDPRWQLSSARAHTMRRLLDDAGLAVDRVQRVTGHADRSPAAENRYAVRNNRLELILLRRSRRDDRQR